MTKQALYKTLIERMDASTKSNNYFESSWYAYTILEDRLRSMLRNSGGENFGNGKMIRMLGPKIEELTKRAASDPLLKANFEKSMLTKWKKDRNDLMHQMADGSLTIEQIDESVKSLAERGAHLARLYSASSRRLKKHRKKELPIS